MNEREMRELTKRAGRIEQMLIGAKREIIEYLYGCLTVLDTKSNSLLQFNSIILVAFGAALHGASPGPLIKWLSFAGIMLSLCSALILLFVVLVKWGEPESTAQVEVDFLRLRDLRTRYYTLAWVFSLVSVIIVSLGVMRIFLFCGGAIDGC